MVREAAERYRFVSVEEYEQIEEQADVRHEYVAGMLYAMVGASRRHNEIALDIVSTLRPIARHRGCGMYVSDVRLRVADDVFYYPDVILTCDPSDSDERVVRQPCLVVEVLSPSTEAIDRREKLVNYRRITGLLAYLIVRTDAAGVERHWRETPAAPWQAQFLAGGSVPISCLDLDLPLAEIYAGVSFDGAPENAG